jgi:hypothetical protein
VLLLRGRGSGDGLGKIVVVEEKSRKVLGVCFVFGFLEVNFFGKFWGKLQLWGFSKKSQIKLMDETLKSEKLARIEKLRALQLAMADGAPDSVRFTPDLPSFDTKDPANIEITNLFDLSRILLYM